MSAHNPYAPPKAIVDVAPAVSAIDSLPVSDSWKRRFKVMHKAGGPSLPRFRNLAPDERKALSPFNVLAFLFGPFYYAFKGMWRKGLTLFVLCCIGGVILDASLANRDYYSKMVLGHNGWWWAKQEARAS
jgi:hypothetical protein